MKRQYRAVNRFITKIKSTSSIDGVSSSGTFQVSDTTVSGFSLPQGACTFYVTADFAQTGKEEIFRIVNVSGDTLTYDKRISVGGYVKPAHTSGASIRINDVADIINDMSESIDNFGLISQIDGTQTVKVWGGVFNNMGTVYNVSSSTLAITGGQLSDNTTNYIHLVLSTQLFTVTASSTLAGAICMGSVVTSGGVIGTITDLRPAFSTTYGEIPTKLDKTGGLRDGMGASREAVEIDASGNEITPTITNGTSIVNTETLRKRKADGSYEEIPFSTILNSITNGITFNRTAVLGEDLSATTYQPIVQIMTGNSTTSNTSPNPFVASSSFGSYGAGFEEFRAFDRTSGTYYGLPANTDNTTDRWLKIDLGASYNIVAVDFQAYSGHPTNDTWATGCKIQGSTNDSTWVDLITYGTLPTTLTRNTFTPGSYRYVRFIGKKLNTTSGTPGVTTFDIYASTSNPKAMAIVSGAVTYSNTLGVNISGNRLLTGIRFSVPYNTTLGVVRTTQVSTYASARIQLRDDSGNLIAEQTPTLSTDTVTFPNTPIAANTVYRLVLNDNANFGNNSNELALVSYQAGFRFAISGTLNGNNSVVPQQIREIQLGSSRAVQATAGSTAEYAILAGFYSGAGVKGSQITLSANDGQLVNVDFADVGSRYYVSNTSGIIDIYAGTISRIVGAALTSTQIYLSNANYPGTNLSKP